METSRSNQVSHEVPVHTRGLVDENERKKTTIATTDLRHDNTIYQKGKLYNMSSTTLDRHHRYVDSSTILFREPHSRGNMLRSCLKSRFSFSLLPLSISHKLTPLMWDLIFSASVLSKCRMKVRVRVLFRERESNLNARKMRFSKKQPFIVV